MKLNLGCGYKYLDGYVNVDMDKSIKCDLVHDLTTRLPFDDGSVDEVVCEQVLEHIHDFKGLVSEVHRVLKDGATVLFSVPEFPCVASVADPDHVRYFVIESFMHFCDPRWFQPSNFSGKGMFDLIGALILRWKNKDEENSKAGKYYTEIRVRLKKVRVHYWEGRMEKPFTYTVMILNRGEGYQDV